MQEGCRSPRPLPGDQHEHTRPLLSVPKPPVSMRCMRPALRAAFGLFRAMPWAIGGWSRDAPTGASRPQTRPCLALVSTQADLNGKARISSPHCETDGRRKCCCKRKEQLDA